jgi:hypothetical protein
VLIGALRRRSGGVEAAVEFDRIAGDLHEGLFQGGLLRCEFDQRDPLTGGDQADPGAVEAADHQRV